MEDKLYSFKNPFFLRWHLTNSCNLECSNCYRENKSSDLPLTVLMNILDNYENFLAERQTLGYISFAGGEPLLSEHLFPLIESANKKKISSRLITNGTLLTKETVKTLKDLDCNSLQITIEGIGENHDDFRGEGNFQETLKGALLAREENMEVTFKVNLSKKNYNQITQLVGLTERWATRLVFSRFVPLGKSLSTTKDVLEPAELRKVFVEIFKLKQKAKVDIPLLDPMWRAFFNYSSGNESAISGCSAGLNGLSLEPNGQLFPCNRLPIALGKAQEKPLTEIWNHHLLKQLRDRNELKGNCGKCRLRWSCGGCRALGLSLMEDPLASDPQCFRDPSEDEKSMFF